LIRIVALAALLVIPIVVTEATEAAQQTSAQSAFRKCTNRARVNCVVDGDTLWLRGEKIRVADIDTARDRSAQMRVGTRARKQGHPASD